jgi:hypothetical protein
MEQYEVKPYKRGGRVIIQVGTNNEIIIFNEKENADRWCRNMNDDQDTIKSKNRVLTLVQ